MANKYPEYILKKLRQRNGMDENDKESDDEFNKCDPQYVFKEVCSWEGLSGGWDNQIKGWIEDIYGINIDEKFE